MLFFTPQKNGLAKESQNNFIQTYMPLELQIFFAAMPPSCSARHTDKSQHQTSAKLGWCTCKTKCRIIAHFFLPADQCYFMYFFFLL